MFLGFLELKAVRENREIRRPVKEEYGLIFDGSPTAARLFLTHVWKLHKLPRQVVSDRGPQFIAEFTWELYQLLGVKLAATTAYHPQGDGQMEQVNQELEQYLQLFVNERQDDWDELLPLAEFQYNNHVHSATQQTPFMLDTGWHLQMGFEPHQAESRLETVNEFQDQMDSALLEARSALGKAKEDMARYYNQRWVPAPEFFTLEIKYTWMQVISKPHVPHRNLPIAISDPSQWHDELGGTCTASDSWPPCLGSIQSST